MAAELGIADRVKFLGFAENPWSYISKSRLFVLPSRWEGFPNIVCEALACGATSLVTDCDFGPSEIVEHGDSGWVVPSDDAGALSKAMGTLLENRGRASRLASRASERVLQFDLQEMVRAYTALFIEQAAERRGARAASIGELQFAEP